MVAPALIGAGMSLLGSLFGGSSAESAAKRQSAAQLQAAQLAADEARFRPVGISTGFGTSQFQFGTPQPTREMFAQKPADWQDFTQQKITPQWDSGDPYFEQRANPWSGDVEYQKALAAWEADPKNKYLSGAGYALTPEMQQIRDAMIQQALTGGMQTAQGATAAQQGLFGLGQQYLAQSPEAAAQQWMQSQQAALAPSRDLQLQKIRQSLFNTGRMGLATAQGEGLQAANPEMQAYYNALAQQDMNLAAQAQEQGRAQTQFGAGLFGTGIGLGTTGYSPLQTQLGIGQTVEGLGQQALGLGSELGGRTSTAGSIAGQLLLRGGLAGAESAGKIGAYSPVGTALTSASKNEQLLSGLSGLFGSSAGPEYSSAWMAAPDQMPNEWQRLLRGY